MARSNPQAAYDFEVVSALVVSGAYCASCIARKAEISVERVLESFRRMESEWREPLIDTARCLACRMTTTIYTLRVP